jgi:uncharacterized UBP type Zn finger protein
MSDAIAKGYRNYGLTCWLSSIYQSLISVNIIRKTVNDIMDQEYKNKKKCN